jgi:hypothetical protein
VRIASVSRVFSVVLLVASLATAMPAAAVRPRGDVPERGVREARMRCQLGHRGWARRLARVVVRDEAGPRLCASSHCRV